MFELVGDTVRFSFDDDGIRRMIYQVAQTHASRVEAVYDKVRLAGQGKSVDEVKVILDRKSTRLNSSH